MLVFNQQANIKNVNGAIADIFANRPAPQSTFYIFYSIDTQEIYYDNGTWVLIGTGGGGTPVNIYNSDGTLNGSRIVNGNSSNLVFNNLAKLTLSSSNGTNFEIVNNNIKTINQGNDIGLKLDFANKNYQLGQLTGGNAIKLSIEDNLQILSTYKGNNRLGLEFDYNNNIFKIGDVNSVANFNVLSIEDGNNQIFLGKPGNINLNIDNTNNIYKTVYNNIDIGLLLNFAQQEYFLGDINFGSGCYAVYGNSLQSIATNNSTDTTVLNHAINNFNTQYNGNDIGLKLDFANTIYQFGQLTGANESVFIVDDSNELIYTTFGGNSNGVVIDLASNSFIFGRITGSNTTNLTINDGATYPVEINGTNVLSGTSGSTSGQHLKIKINGVDYKIELKNP